MSGTLSAAVRFDDHFGPLVGSRTPRRERFTPEASLSRSDTARLRALVEQMHRSVVLATKATDREAKVELWEAYRLARAEAITLTSAPDAGGPRLRSV